MPPVALDAHHGLDRHGTTKGGPSGSSSASFPAATRIAKLSLPATSGLKVIR
jgi:hypothetical protein